MTALRRGVAALSCLFVPGLARAGDPTAHTAATVTVASAIAKLPEFANGVGAPQFRIPKNSPNEAACPYNAAAKFGDGSCPYSDPNGLAINEPDNWNCLDPRQPPVITALNAEFSFSESLLASILGDVGLPTVMACNWNHFTTNPALPLYLSAQATSQTVALWADEIPTGIQHNTGFWSCSVGDWKRYWNRVVNGLHYIQDMQTEHHAIGNQVCPQADVIPSVTFNQFFTFGGTRACADFLSTTIAQAESLSIACDDDIVDPTSLFGPGLTTDMFFMNLLCELGVPLACMGLERVLRHHCNVPGSGPTKSIVCAGPRSDHLTSTTQLQYCEGEIYDHGGGQDFLGAAISAGQSVLLTAAERWAAVCQGTPPDGPPDPPGIVALVTGDPHLLTFDGERYDGQPWGEETLVVSPTDNDLEVQVRTRQLNSRNVTVIVAEGAQVATDRLAFYLDGTVTLNGVAATFGLGMTTLPGRGSVWGLPNEYVVVWPDSSQLWVTLRGFYMGAQVFLPDSRRGQVFGLLGNANGDPHDDLTTRDGFTTLTSPASFNAFYKTYVESWRITQSTSLFDYETGQSTDSPDITNRNFPFLLETVEDLASAEVQTATATCQGAGVTSDWTDACVLDIALSNGDTRAASAFADAPPVTSTFDVQSPCAVCTAGQSCCNGTCTLTTVDGANCGGCGVACSASGATCTNSTCGCSPPKSTQCGQDAGAAGACVDLTSDSGNCGKCGTVCSGTTPVCSNGSCVATCNTASGQTQCATQCVTLGNDNVNCGACGKVCSASEVCSGGMCTALSSINAAGCADSTREAFVNQAIFPAIAACAGGWDGNGSIANYTGVFPAPLRTTSPACAQNGNSGPNPKGAGCSAIDLCAAGWHICAGGEVIVRVQQAAPDAGIRTDGCAAETWPARSFFAAAIGSTGFSICAEPYGTVTGPSCTNASGAVGCQANPGLTNDIFGCGSEGVAVSTCGDVDRSGGNLCGSLDSGWSCGTDGLRESVNAVHNPSPAGAASGGGVLCCMSL
jgi:hypothetical protein